MNLNENERIYAKQIQKEVEIPAVVVDKLQESYRKIENHEVIQEKVVKGASYWIRFGTKVAGGMAAVLAAGFIVCVANPVMAKELPVVGGLFAQLQDKVSFFGNFADKATPLVDPVSEEAADATDVNVSERLYTVKENGLEISFSEVYANDQAVYLTMTAKNDEPFPDTMMMQETDKPIISLTSDYSYSFLEEVNGMNIVYPEGVFTDENTYACIIRLDLAEAAQDYSEYEKQYEIMCQNVMDEMGITDEDMDEEEKEEEYAVLGQYIDEVSARAGALDVYKKTINIPEKFSLHLDISQLVGTKAEPQTWDSGYTEEELVAMSEEEFNEVMNKQPADTFGYPNKYENYWYDGNWSFDIPVTIDNTQTITQEINETNEAGIGLKSVIKTPYELTVNELYTEGSDSDCFMVALDANGNKLPYNDSNSNCNNFAIQDRDISTVDIYILDYVQYMDELKGEEKYNNNENKSVEEKWSTLLDANAKYHKTLHF